MDDELTIDDLNLARLDCISEGLELALAAIDAYADLALADGDRLFNDAMEAFDTAILIGRRIQGLRKGDDDGNGKEKIPEPERGH